MKPPSPNFAFLEPRDPLLHGYASRAERYFSDDPTGSLVKMRQFAEALTHVVAGQLAQAVGAKLGFVDLLRSLYARVPDRMVDLLHQVRKLGNDPNHAHANAHRDALTALHVGHQLAVWFHATFRVVAFKPNPVVMPPNPAHATAALSAELEAIRAEAAEVAASSERSWRQSAAPYPTRW